jgi:16S rRNA (guanine(966)-N(2))-methyltransferase RsmD
MRIIAGHFKGRRLTGPPATGVRPTSDRLRETLFNVLGPHVTGARVLDGFAGTGAVGLEALSRGAASVTFVEQSARALATLRDNVARCGVDEACAIIRDDFSGLTARRPDIGTFDLVLLDPPYDYVALGAVLAEAARVLAPGGRLVLEHSRRRETPDQAGGARRYRVLGAGDSALSFYTAPADDVSHGTTV